MKSKHVSVFMAAALVVMAASPGQAIDKCRVKVDKKTGVISVDMGGIGGPVGWSGDEGGPFVPFFNDATCIDSRRGKGKKCVLADPTTVEAKTPPDACAIHVDDGGLPCSAWIRGCTPGIRSLAGAVIVETVQGAQAIDITSPIFIPIGGTFYTIVRTVTVDTPSAGTIVAGASLSAAHNEEGGETFHASCGLSTEAALDSTDRLRFDLSDTEDLVVSPTRTFDVAAAGSVTIDLLCRTYGTGFPVDDPATMTVSNSSLVATFIPN